MAPKTRIGRSLLQWRGRFARTRNCLLGVGIFALTGPNRRRINEALRYEIVATLPSGPDPELFTQDQTGKILYVANENDNTVTIIDLERRVPLGGVQVGVEPEGMGLSPDGKILVATSE